MKTIVGLGVVVCLSLLGCGKDASKEIEKLADRACACTDAACADKVLADLVAFAKANKNAKGDQERANKAGIKLGQCVVKAGVSMQAFSDAMKEMQSM